MRAGERGGAIVNLALIMGFSGGGLYPNISYQASKGAVVNLTRAFAIELAKDNIRVNAVAPVRVRTGFIAPVLAKPELVAAIEGVTPMGQLVEPEEVAAAILFLASPAASMTTGHVIAVDGGYLAQWRSYKATIASISNNAPGRASAGTPIAVLAGGAAMLRYWSRTSRKIAMLVGISTM
jgi:NAD(P)-dependent dehydrogenase (short-subunit alcohol dehydrogenase family)